MMSKYYVNALLRVRYNLNPGYTWAVEHFAKMRNEIPNFERIWEGKEPQAFIVVEETKTQVRLQIEPQKWEWHSKEFYLIVPAALDFITSK